MENHVAAEPERPPIFFGRRIELQLVLFVDCLRRYARKISAGDSDKRRGGIGLNARLLDIEIRQLHGVRAARRERVHSRAVAQPVCSELAGDSQIRGGAGRFADNVRRARERPIEARRERLEIRDGDVVGELRFSESPSARVPAALAFTSGPVSASSLMLTTSFANDPVACPESIAIPAIVDSSARRCRSRSTVRWDRPSEPSVRRPCRQIRSASCPRAPCAL